ncbi:MAG: alpha-1,2-fucosyltransferase [Planctomycetales bacterium]|nr:alpha-1,2-fucosyltransferase [Planctomycetales bacterium]
MIITRLIGGLGNQLFQYAYGLYLANQAGQELMLDDSAYESYQLHALAIDRFAITAKRMPAECRRRIPGRYRGTTRTREAIEQFVGRFRSTRSAPLTLRREKPFGYQEAYVKPGVNLYLDGYWQGERFFPGMRDRLRREFALRDPLSSESRAVGEKMSETESVAVHVRRGDYVTDPETQAIYRCLESEYYRACLADLRQRVAGLHVFLFSNDPAWCLANLDVGVPFTPVTHNGAATAHEDLFLMTQCRHAVIANSSFSWWGAYLANDRAERRVYYPQPWFNAGTQEGGAIGCHDWIGEQTIAALKTNNTAA